MTPIEIEKLADALSRRIMSELEARIVDQALDIVRSMENTMTKEADSIAKYIVARLKDAK